ncbi:hypothetical protein APHAL10511_001660 [Amanita phalloides]|nr:hypothetical protein APHAL10511_001660 [Amanita phalloides]
MSQQFTLFNLDKRESLAKSGSISEIVCSKIPPSLVSLLLKPGKTATSSDGLGAWAGHRLVCAGDQTKQYPAGMLAPQEEIEVQNHAADGTALPDFYRFACDAFVQAPLPSSDVPKFSGGQVWVLRNHSKRVYVRADVLAGKPEVKGPFVEPFGFGDLLLANITWSSDGVNMEHGDMLVLGPWAGDRFDIVPWDVAKKEMKKEKKSKPWRDVSDDQAKRTRLLLSDIF